MHRLSSRWPTPSGIGAHPRSFSGHSSVASVGNGGMRGWNADGALRASAALWFFVAVIGQLLFATYVVGFYGRTATAGHPEQWNSVMPHGYVAGAAFGNAVVAMHLLLAVFIVVGGALQLTAPVRRRWPRFHRWNGRVYLSAVTATSIGGLIIVWGRGSVGDLAQHIAISINAVLIMACAAMALRYALARRFDVHRRWALRLFLCASGVWFFRIGLMFWIVVNHGPVGFDADAFRGPTLTAIAFGQYLVPLAVAELYFRAQRGGWRGRAVMATALTVLSLLTAAGIAAAAAILWLPQL